MTISKLLYKINFKDDKYYAKIYSKLKKKEQEEMLAKILFEHEGRLHEFKQYGLIQAVYFFNKIVYTLDRDDGLVLSCCTIKRLDLSNDQFSVTNY